MPTNRILPLLEKTYGKMGSILSDPMDCPVELDTTPFAMPDVLLTPEQIIARIQSIHESVVEPEITDLRKELEIAKIRITALEIQVGDLRNESTRALFNIAPDINCEPDLGYGKVIAVTIALFGKAPTIEVSHDPEDPDNSFIVVTVASSGEPRELVKKRLEWHDQIASLYPVPFGSIRLSIISA